MNRIFSIFLFILHFIALQSQPTLPDSCKLLFGTNLSGLFDWGTELPFVDMMRNCREWYSKDDSGEFESRMIDRMQFRSDGYPTHIPQNISGVTRPQFVATIWGRIAGWQLGDYTVFYDGRGEIDINVGVENYRRLDAQSYSFRLTNTKDREIQLIITKSDSLNPVRNIKIIHQDYLQTYKEKIFNPNWLNYLRIFKSVRFMDWGHTNHWSQKDSWLWDLPGIVDWRDRAQLNYYTWTTNKGIPYEVMIRLMNELDLDAWICIPHRASDDYIRNMAALFKSNVEIGRHLYVEYSNEIWNWIFGQAVWLDENFCKPVGTWPECYVPAIQNALDVWTSVYANELSKITRILGAFTGWYDVSNRVAMTMNANSFDAIAPTYYFGISEKSDSILDELGSRATIADIAREARLNMQLEFDRIQSIQSICNSLQKKMIFYEGGHHLTAHPFGELPSYENALNAIHRDSAIYNLYNEWFQKLRSLQNGNEPLLCMNFSFIYGIDAKYGSWGVLESIYQDLTIIPTPKYNAIIKNQSKNCIPTNYIETNKKDMNVEVLFDPNSNELRIQSIRPILITLVSSTGQVIFLNPSKQNKSLFSLDVIPSGMYYVRIDNQFYSKICKFK